MKYMSKTDGGGEMMWREMVKIMATIVLPIFTFAGLYFSVFNYIAYDRFVPFVSKQVIQQKLRSEKRCCIAHSYQEKCR